MARHPGSRQAGAALSSACEARRQLQSRARSKRSAERRPSGARQAASRMLPPARPPALREARTFDQLVVVVLQRSALRGGHCGDASQRVGGLHSAVSKSCTHCWQATERSGVTTPAAAGRRR